jgi:pimeloyl-ACP methyl ester carboxylesterase
LRGFPDLPASLHYDGPTYFIAGSASDYVMPEYRSAIAARFPQAKIEWIADAGHWPHIEQPARFLGMLEGFLQEL